MGKGGKSDEEGRELWARIAETATPLRKRKHARVRPTPLKPERSHHRAPKPEVAPSLAKPKPKAPPLPHRAELDRQTSRRLGKGRLEVEAKLDLHGMRQRDAHAALRRFLKSAQDKDYRHVLVITGKGVAQEAAKSFYEEEARGVLRQAVPQWLSDPEFASIVVSFSQAPRRLGGEGALYVRLRKPR
ncbi:MAG TPA: Smr/MutS family protein [Methyloceanibacter sp.]|nr:Smr/MutS family protein [Methyloceanibacter sp.]